MNSIKLTEELKNKLSNELLSTGVNVMIHEDIVRITSDKVLSQTIPWEGYQKANLISEKELELIKKYDKKTLEQKKTILEQEGNIYSELFLDLLIKINKEETLQYILTLLDQAIKDYSPIINNLLSIKGRNPFDILLRILNRNNLDWFTNAKTSNILTKFIIHPNGLKIVKDEHLKLFVQWCCEQLRKVDEKDTCNAIYALQQVLTLEKFRPLMIENDSILLLLNILKTKMKNFQILYQTLNCLWLLSYNKKAAEKISESKIIHTLVDILKQIPKEKVQRMTLAILVNLLGISNSNEQMIDSGILRPLENLSNKNWADDDIVNDLNILKETLEKNVQELSSFEKYKKEIFSGQLEWSPVHRSEKFWKENVLKFEEDKNKLILALKDILSTSSDATSLCIACHDLGEFARFHPRGKIIIEQTGAKIPLMKLMEDKDPEVKKHALLAVQKLMITNWEYLSAS
jgi:V-type H+-transporting ATPase subunit H